MNEEIKQLIEEERRRYDSDTFSFFTEEERVIAKAEFASGANFILHQNRWRKFGTDKLPEIGQQIVCKSSSGRYHLSNPISHDGIHWLAENFIEWKPI